MDNIKKIKGGKIVTPQGIIENGTIIIKDGIILDIFSENIATEAQNCIHDVDAKGLWVLPGMIDTHSDAIEQEIQPRSNSILPIEVSFSELERKLASQGITTMYHSLSFSDTSGNWVRRNETVQKIVRKIKELAQGEHLIQHKIHIRFETRNIEAADLIQELMDEKLIDQISFMDHTPGQGQWHNIELQKEFMVKKYKMSEAEAQFYIEERKKDPKVGLETLDHLAKQAKKAGIPLATHDDDSFEKLDLLERWQGTICEFPLKLEVAQRAREMGFYVALGAPNVLLGGSHSNNLSAIDAVRIDAVDILCSDYYPPSMLQAVFLLYHQGFNMSRIVNMVSHNPAKALGISHEVGSLEIGKKANILLIREHKQLPIIEKVIVEGKAICQMGYRNQQAI